MSTVVRGYQLSGRSLLPCCEHGHFEWLLGENEVCPLPLCLQVTDQSYLPLGDVSS